MGVDAPVTADASPPTAAAPTPHDSNRVAAFITLVACVASVVLAQSVTSSWHVVAHRPLAFATFLVLTLVLQVIVVDVYGRGTLSFAGTGLLATGIAFGVGPGDGRRRARRRRAARADPQPAAPRRVQRGELRALGGGGRLRLPPVPRGGPQHVRAPRSVVLARAAYCVVNVGLLTIVMSLAEGLRPLAVWNERFRWFTPYYLVSGPLAVALTSAYSSVGLVGMLAFTMPPAMMMLSIRQYVSRTRQSVEEVRHANDELRRANSALEERNDDLHELFEFAGGLAARGHDRESLVVFAQEALGKLTGTQVRVNVGLAEAGDQLLVAGGQPLGSVSLEESQEYDDTRWKRLREALLPQLATAVESSELVEQVRKTHLQTIAALSRSMEAKDYYTGGHTERVATVSVALARRLGFSGAELDAVEIGALLHDIGKIGIPERILHKPDAARRRGVEGDAGAPGHLRVHPLRRSSCPRPCSRSRGRATSGWTERGYPDGLAGEDIPLAARIVLVADAFDALTSDRPYRAGRHIPAAFEELREHAGTQFCPRVIEALEAVLVEEPSVLGAELRVVSVA